MALSGDLLLAGVPTPKYEGLELFNIRVPEHPIRLGGLRTEGAVRGVDARGALALLATDAFGLVAVDVQDPARPFTVARAATAGLATGVRLEGILVHVSVTQADGGAGYVQTFDVSQPSLPLVSTTPLSEDALALEPTPGRFYTLTSNVRVGQQDGLRLTIYDRQGQRLGGVVVDATPRAYAELVHSRLTVRGGRAYVTVGSRLYVFDVSDEAAPRVLQSTELGAPARGLTWAGGSLLVSTTGDSTLVTVPPTDLLVVGTSPVNGALASPLTTIRVDMSLPVQPDSVTADTFSVTQVGPGGAQPVEGTREVVFATRGSSLTFIPAAPLAPGAQIEVTVDGVLGFDTRPLAHPVSFTFLVAGEDALQPVVDRLEPASGLVSDFTATTVQGAGFRAGVAVKVAGQSATVLSVQPERIEIVVPPSISVAGPAAVEVVDPSGLSAVRLGGFLYREPLRLALLSPDRSPQQGGVAVEVRGTGFMPGLSVRFGGTSSFQVDVPSMERAVAVAPPHAQGLVDVEAVLGPQSAVKPRSFLYGTGAVSRLPTPPVRDVRVEGTVAYVALGGESDIVGLDAEGHLVTYEQGRRTSNGALLVADIGEPTVVREVKRLTLSAAGGVRRMAKAGNTLYLAAGSQGVVAVDVTQPANAAVKLTLPVQGEAVDVVASDSLIFVADSSGVRVFRTGETEQPMLMAQRALPGGASALALYGGLLLASNASATDARLYVLDARRGDLPPLSPAAQLPLSAPARHIAVEGTRAFISLGRAGQVAIAELTDPTAPAPAGTLVLRDELNQGWISAEQALVAGDVVWVAAGGGKAQRFLAPVGQTPQWLETAAVMGDAKALSRAGRYLMVGTLLLDVDGRPVELPLADARDKTGVLAGGLVSVALDHLELRGTVPVAGAVVPLGVMPEALLTALPDMATASAVRLESADGAEVQVARQSRADTEGGRLALVPQSPLSVGTEYVLRVGATLADLGGRALGADVAVRFRTGPSAAPEQPVILAMAPVTGLEAGGDAAVLSGEGFLPGCQVWVGDALAQGVTVSADGTRLNLTVPPGSAGAAAVRVRNPNGLEALRLGLYRYLVPPELTHVSPNHAPFNSRQRVQLTGKGFAAATQVTLGGRPALHPVLDAQGRLSVEVPDDVTGVVEVAVATPMPGGALVARMPEGFTYTLKPLGSVAGGAEALAVAGRVLLVARAGRLVALDSDAPG